MSYSLDPSEQALAWRLQTLATAHGIEMYVPTHGSTHPSQAGTSPVAIHSAIDRSDCVLAIITARANTNIQKELKYALAKGKVVIPIVHSDLQGHPLLAQFPRVFVFSPSEDPGILESKVADFLKAQKVSKEKQQAIGALVALGVGLLLLLSLSEK